MKKGNKTFNQHTKQLSKFFVANRIEIMSKNTRIFKTDTEQVKIKKLSKQLKGCKSKIITYDYEANGLVNKSHRCKKHHLCSECNTIHTSEFIDHRMALIEDYDNLQAKLLTFQLPNVLVKNIKPAYELLYKAVSETMKELRKLELINMDTNEVSKMVLTNTGQLEMTFFDYDKQITKSEYYELLKENENGVYKIKTEKWNVENECKEYKTNYFKLIDPITEEEYKELLNENEKCLMNGKKAKHNIKAIYRLEYGSNGNVIGEIKRYGKGIHKTDKTGTKIVNLHGHQSIITVKGIDFNAEVINAIFRKHLNESGISKYYEKNYKNKEHTDGIAWCQVKGQRAGQGFKSYLNEVTKYSMKTTDLLYLSDKTLLDVVETVMNKRVLTPSNGIAYKSELTDKRSFAKANREETRINKLIEEGKDPISLEEDIVKGVCFSSFGQLSNDKRPIYSCSPVYVNKEISIEEQEYTKQNIYFNGLNSIYNEEIIGKIADKYIFNEQIEETPEIDSYDQINEVSGLNDYSSVRFDKMTMDTLKENNIMNYESYDLKDMETPKIKLKKAVLNEDNKLIGYEYLNEDGMKVFEKYEYFEKQKKLNEEIKIFEKYNEMISDANEYAENIMKNNKNMLLNETFNINYDKK